MTRDSPQLAPRDFLAYKYVALQHSLGNWKVTAVSVQDYGTDRFSKMFLFMYSVPDCLHSHLNRWVAVIETGLELNHHFFQGKNQYGDVEEVLNVQEKVVENCNILTLGQSFVD